MVGMGCRYPGGVRDPEDLLATARGTGRTRYPASRRTAAGRSAATLLDAGTGPSAYARCGGFVAGCGVSSTRAFFRYLARVRRWRWTRSSGCCWRCAWEALERAGIDPTSLRGQPDRGVRRRHRPAATAAAGRRAGRQSKGYLLTGNARSVISGPGRLRARPGGPGGDAWTRPARPRWWRCTWRAQALRAGRVHAGAGRRRHGDGHARRCSSSSAAQGGLAAGRAVQGVRGGRGRHRAGARASGVLVLKLLSAAEALGGTGCWR